jgi:shikimate 5-dehydrogenase
MTSTAEYLANWHTKQRDPQFWGANTTIPFKQIILPNTQPSPAVLACGAYNTLYKTIDSGATQWHTDNTDIVGIRHSLNALLLQIPPKPCPVVLFGNGGAANAVLYTIDMHFAACFTHIYIVGRRQRSVYATQYVPQTHIRDTDMVWLRRHAPLFAINTLPLGYGSQLPNTLLNDWFLENQTVAFLEAVYFETLAYRMATHKNIPALHGQLWLETSAMASANLWYNIPSLQRS